MNAPEETAAHGLDCEAEITISGQTFRWRKRVRLQATRPAVTAYESGIDKITWIGLQGVSIGI